MTGKIKKKILVFSEPGSWSTGSDRANSQAGFGLHPDRSHAGVGQVPGRPVGPIRVLKH